MPTSLSRSEGDIHADGNPHIHTDPVNAIIIARNILTGLRRVSPDNAATFTAREQDFERRVLEATIGADLVNVLTAPVAYDLLKSDKLYDFLGTKQYQGKPLLDRLGGWMKEAQVFRGKEIACYHKEWAYFSNRYQVTCAEYIEAKPGIPPTPGHVQEVIALMKQRKIRVLFASNYFDRNQIRQVAQRTGAQAVDRAGEHQRRAGRQHLLRPHERLGERPRVRPSREALLMDLSLFLPPLAACLVIVAIHSYLGLHVIAREVIFVDLSLAQMAALGSAVAILAGSQPDSTAVVPLRARLHHHRRGALRAHAHAGEGPRAAGGVHRHRLRRRLGGGDPGGRPDSARRRGDQGHPGGQPAVGELAGHRPAGRGLRRHRRAFTGCSAAGSSRSRSSPRPRSPTAGASAGGISCST